MKKFTLIFLSVLLLLPLVSCSEPEKKTNEKEGTDLFSLSATELYALGCEKNTGLRSAEFETVIASEGDENQTVKTVRIREGYDAFSYSRVSSDEEVYFSDGKAFCKDEDGAFTAETSARVFQEYLDAYTIPYGAFGAENLFDADKKGLTVTYTIQKSEVLSRFAELTDGFSPALLEGEATFDEEGVLKEEVFTVSGTKNGEKKLFTVTNTLLNFRSPSIAVDQPLSTEGYVSLSDIRLPKMIEKAALNVTEKKDVQATFVFANTLLVGEKSYSHHSEVTVYQNLSGETPLAYLTRQSLKTVPGADYESRFYQKRIADGVQKENYYNLVTAELLSESESTTLALPWPMEAEEILPLVSDLASMEMTEDSAGYSVRFTLTPAAQKKWAEKKLALLPESAVTALDGVTCALKEGSFLISRDLVLTSFSYGVELSFALPDGVAGSFQGQYSMNVDALQEITVPEMQVPTPTTPDMAPEGAVD